MARVKKLARTLTMLGNGQVFDFDNPDMGLMTPEILAKGLHRINRWNGHAIIGCRSLHVHRLSPEDSIPMTDLHHSFLVYLLAKRMYPEDHDLHLQALLHDAGEVFYGDIIGPVKKGIKKYIRPIENGVESLIARRYGCGFPWDARIKIADLASQDIEGYICFPKSVPGVNVRDDREISKADEILFWKAYDMAQDVQKYIRLLDRHDSLGQNKRKRKKNIV